MPALDIKPGNNGQFLLSGILSRDTVMNNWSLRDKGFKQGSEVLLDLAGVTKVDTAGLAWLVNLVAECRSLKIPLKLSNVPLTLLKLAKISDVEGILPLQ
jgi:phospholipid transport system transporter-binding protein